VNEVRHSVAVVTH